MSTAAAVPAVPTLRAGGAGDTAGAPGYRDFVRPGHPLVGELMGDPPERGTDAVATVRTVLGTARRRLRYDPAPGRHDFEELRRRAAAAGGGPLELNCIDGACLVASQLRAAGFGADEVWVALGGRVSRTGVDLGAEFHAWLAVLLGDGRLLWIDPARWQPCRRRGEEVLAEHRLYAVFNDLDVRVTEREKRRLLAADGGAVPRLYLFGRPQPELTAAIRDAAFHRLAVGLARDGSTAAADVDAGQRERWIAAGLLAADGGRLVAGPKLLVVPRHAEAEARAAVGRQVDRYLEIVAATVPRLRRAYAATAAARRWSWEQVSHAVVGGMLLDLSVGREFGILARVRRERGENVIWAFEHVSSDQGIGVVWAEAPDGHWAAGQLWHRAVERPPVRLAPAMVELLGELALGAAPPAASAELLYLRHQRLVRRGGDGFEMLWPTFVPADAARLSGPLAAAGHRLFTDAVVPALDAVARRPWWRESRGDDSHRHAVLRLLLDYACEGVFAGGLLDPPPGGETPVWWGRWLWLGRRGDALPRSRDAEAGGRGDDPEPGREVPA